MNSGMLGNCLIMIAIFLQLASVILQKKVKIYTFLCGSLALVLSFMLLVRSFIVSDFTIRNVFLNSSTLSPMIYKVAASWSSHEGSMLLWISLLSAMSIIYYNSYARSLSWEVRNLQISILSFVQLAFSCFILLTSNPFGQFTFLPAEGLGLNPMLQDSALMIHPPSLYLGYVSYIALFANSLLILLFPAERGLLTSSSKQFSAFALMFTSIGVALGSWWAYRELGWGGFWFFDPVENISILPWLIGIAAHHFLIVNIKSGKYFKMSLVFCLLPFLISLIGMFLVRSGIITSVHSFAFSPERGLYLFLIVSILSCFSLGLFVLKSRFIIDAKGNNKAIFAQNILIGNYLWLLAFLVMFVAITYPIYFSFAKNIDAIIDPEYYIKVFLPIFVPIILLSGFTPWLKHQSLLKNVIFLVISLLAAIYIDSVKYTSLLSFLILSSSIYLMLQMPYNLMVATDYFAHVKSKQISLFLGHFGFGLLAFAITMNSLFSSELKFTGRIGEKVESEDLSVVLRNIKFAKGENYLRQIAEFEVEDRAGNIVILKPENRLYQIEKSLSQEADIFSFLTHDLYAVLSKVDGKVINSMIYYRPVISLVWFSAILIIGGFCLLLFERGRGVIPSVTQRGDNYSWILKSPPSGT